MQIRRVVTGHAGGKSVVVSDGASPKALTSSVVPDSATALLWVTAPSPIVPKTNTDAVSPRSTIVPAVGETRLVAVTFPSERAFVNADLAAFAAENAAFAPDFMRHFEANNPGMHTTDTVDYGIVAHGEIWLEVDDGEQVRLGPGDIVVQNGTRHAWRNKSNAPATVVFVLIGATRL